MKQPQTAVCDAQRWLPQNKIDILFKSVKFQMGQTQTPGRTQRRFALNYEQAKLVQARPQTD